VVHPGIVPEYRNSHGCFWALARRDLDRVGASLIQIDEGVDTGLVYGYYTVPFDERNESHLDIQRRVVYENLEQIAHVLEHAVDGTRQPLDTSGRTSAAWGQPRLTDYLGWKRAARCSSAPSGDRPRWIARLAAAALNVVRR
jgi:methionyl-tRNA formyltransferase